MAKYCYECHGNNDATRKADLNLQFFATEESWMLAHDTLDMTLYSVDEGEMPPKKAKAHPSEAEREVLVGWLKNSVQRLATAAKNDPGLVVAPRLNHIEYDLVIRDLTGRDVNAARFFPRDSGGGEGFTNVGEDLTMEVGLLENWLDAARLVASHARIAPGRELVWSAVAQPTQSEQQSAYFVVRDEWQAWHEREFNRQTERHRDQWKRKTGEKNKDGKPVEVEEWIAAYLKGAWVYHHRARLGTAGKGDLDTIARAQKPALLPSVLDRIYAIVRRTPADLEKAGLNAHAELARRWQALPAPGASEAARIDELCLAINKDIIAGPREGKLRPLAKAFRTSSSSGFGGRIWTPFTPYPGMAMDLIASKAEQSSSGEATVTPKDLEANPYYLLAPDIRRNASAESRAELDRLIDVAKRIHRPNLAADRAQAVKVIGEFATRAWREPFSPQKLDQLLALYDRARTDGLSLDTAVKQTLVGVLVSPRFIYRFQQSKGSTEPRPLAPRELASRLSFALWGSLPDTDLLAAADAGTLIQPAEIQRQVARMVADDRARTLGKQFAGQWLHYADFAERAQPDPERYKDFSPELARDMEEEATRFMIDVFRSDRPITWLVNADSSELSLRLAGYYGLVDNTKTFKGGGKLEEWKRYPLPPERRGMLGMGAILVGKSQPLRTSPIKRGAWVVLDLLGTPMPEPPMVPPISEDEVSPTGLTIAQQMERHRADPSCMSCHVKLDPMGLALENFGPDGRWRVKDGQGNALVTTASAPDGTPIEGVQGLVRYLEADARRDQIARQFSRKLLGYLLGRGVHLGDRYLIDEMVDAMKRADWRVMPALQVAVTSPQFMKRRDEPKDAKLADTGPSFTHPEATRPALAANP